MSQQSKQRSDLEIRLPLRYYGRVSFESDEPSMTKQSFKDECDINVIMRRYEASGILPIPQAGEPRYADLTTSSDFQAAMMEVAAARTAFAELPARIRDRFDNDPARLLEFLDDPRNVEEGRELGLYAPEDVPPVPTPVRVVADAPSGVLSDPQGSAAAAAADTPPKKGK